MDIEARQDAFEIVRQVWPDECEIAGIAAVAELADDPRRFALPDAGDHIDLMPIMEVLKGAIELVAACLTLYSTACALQKGRADPDTSLEAQLAVKLDQGTRDGTITNEQASELRKLILARV